MAGQAESEQPGTRRHRGAGGKLLAQGMPELQQSTQAADAGAVVTMAT